MPEPDRNPRSDVAFGSDAAVREMVAAFERCTWPCERWTHRAHIGVAVSYLQQWPFATGMGRAGPETAGFLARGAPAGGSSQSRTRHSP